MSTFVPYAEAETSGLDNVKSMKMQTSGKAFFVIIAKIYSYKIRSMIREISCNAADIHKVTGQTKPFIVTVPSEFNPVFTVRDFGTGLSEEGMSLFTTVFESSKEGSENETGYYGLGSKSPFAYTTSFNVISYYNGTMSHYTVFLDGAKEPKYAKVFEVPTDEENGLEIQISVENKDISSFIKETRDVLSSMTLPYDLHGAEKLKKYHFFDSLAYSSYSSNPKFKTSFDTPDAHVIITTAFDRDDKLRSNWFAQLGDVLYPIERRELRCALPDHYGIMKFNPKDLDIPPSRETLEYTPKTENAIREKVSLIDAQIHEFFSTFEPKSISDIEYMSYKGLGTKTKFQYSFLAKPALQETKMSFRHSTGVGFNYRTQPDHADRIGNKFPVLIYDTQRSANILKQYSLTKMTSSACHVISLVDKSSNAIVYSKEYAKKLKKLKDDLIAGGLTVHLISELMKDVKLDATKQKAVMYKLDKSANTYSPTYIKDLAPSTNVLFYSSTNTTTETTIREIHRSGLFANIIDFDIYKVQNSKMSYAHDKFKKKYPTALILQDEDEYFKYLACKTINFNVLSDVQLISMYFEQEGYETNHTSAYKDLKEISSLYDKIETKAKIEKYAQLVYDVAADSNCHSSVFTSKLARVGIDIARIEKEFVDRGIDIELVLTLNDIAKRLECSAIVKPSAYKNKNYLRKVKFTSDTIKHILTPSL